MTTSLETITEHVPGPGGNGCLVQVSKENCNTKRLKALPKNNIFIWQSFVSISNIKWAGRTPHLQHCASDKGSSAMLLRPEWENLEAQVFTPATSLKAGEQPKS